MKLPTQIIYYLFDTENNIPESIVASLTHDIFIKGCQYNFEIDKPHDVEVCQLYPEIPYTSIQDFFDGYLPLPLSVSKLEENILPFHVTSQLEEKEKEAVQLVACQPCQ